jgi:AraC family transcriptional regulator, regulatory protein of adaptative response / DNA-3-methyladenine glycosylase II
MAAHCRRCERKNRSTRARPAVYPGDVSLEPVRVPIRGAYDWPAALGFLARRAIPGVEVVTGDTYRRAVRDGAMEGVLHVSHEDGSLLVAFDQVGSRSRRRAAVPAATLARVRSWFDVDADLDRVTPHLSRDPSLAPLVRARPALRVFGGWDAFEVAIRTIVGQQVSVVRARDLNGVLVARGGARLARGASASSNGAIGNDLERLFPTPHEVLAADLSALGMPGARIAALKTIAAAVVEDPSILERRSSIDETVARLRALRGIGEWTAQYIAMRACRHPDAFPASDVGLLRGAADTNGRRPTPAELLARAEAWRPYRAYAAHQLWAADQARVVNVGLQPRRPDP